MNTINVWLWGVNKAESKKKSVCNYFDTHMIHDFGGKGNFGYLLGSSGEYDL